jgi:lipopolysaccharide transport system ATP-binding protein
MDPEALRLFDTVERAFTVRGASREFGMVRLQHRWLDESATGDMQVGSQA